MSNIDLLIYLMIGATQMNTDQYSEKSYFAQGALEINSHAREQEKNLALMQAIYKAETAKSANPRPGWLKAFFTRLQASQTTPNRQTTSSLAAQTASKR
jgi:hypothetical protein